MTIAGGVMVAVDGLLVDTRPGGKPLELPDPELLDVGYLAEGAMQAARLTVVVAGYGDVDLVAPAKARGVTVVERPETPWRVRVDVAGSYPVTIVLLERDRQQQAGPWQGLEGRELWRALVAFERAVGLPWHGGIGRTAEALILSTHPRAKGGVPLERVELPAIASEFFEHPCNWVRPLTADEQRRRFVHAYDANAQYLSAWIVAELGTGQPEHFKGKQPFDPTSAGVWRVKRPKLDELASLPACFGAGDWFTTPTVARMAEVYGSVAVLESWRWPGRSRFLRAAGERLRDARAELLTRAGDSPGIAAALDAVKALYRVQTGRLSMGARDERSGWRRPDWGNTVRATARVNLHRRLSKLEAAPFAIATDGLIFATDVADPAEFAASIGLPIGTGLGEYSLEGTARLSELGRAFADASVRLPAGPGGVFAALRATRAREGA